MLLRTIAPLKRNSLVVPDWWAPLFATCARRSIFVSADWLNCWLEVYGAELDGRWIRWEVDGMVVGGCLLVFNVERKVGIPLRSVYFNATAKVNDRTPFAEFNDVLYLDEHRQSIATDLSEYLHSLRWDRVHLSAFEAGGVLHELAGTLSAAEVSQELQEIACVDLAKVKESTLESGLSANTRSQLRRSATRYSESFGPLSLHLATSVSEALQFLHQLAVLHNQRRRSKGEPGAFENTSILLFHRLLIERLLPLGQTDLLRLMAGTTPIGYTYNFRLDGKVYFFQCGFRYDADNKLKPGLVTHANAIASYVASGESQYDFLAGDAQYKRSLSNMTSTLYWSVVFRRHWRMRVLLALRKLSHRIRREA